MIRNLVLTSLLIGSMAILPRTASAQSGVTPPSSVTVVEGSNNTIQIPVTFNVTAFAFYRYYNGTDHFYTTNFNELGNGASGYVLEGIASYIPLIQYPETIPLYRYYNGINHFYTANFDELGNGANGYVLEGIAGYVFPFAKDGTVPLYRYYNGTDHFYTTNFNELGTGASGYVLEGIAGYVFSQ